jgi:hypothetical protein
VLSRDRVLNILVPTGLILAVAFFAYWVVDLSRVVHDKAVNADGLQRLPNDGAAVPLNVVLPPNNRWTAHAFIAEQRKADPGRQISVLILDDHYRGDDPTYRTASGVIGEGLSIALLCSVPAQADAKGVRLDPDVAQLIHSKCRSVR